MNDLKGSAVEDIERRYRRQYPEGMPQLLNSWYWGANLSVIEIADRLNVSSSSVYRWLSVSDNNLWAVARRAKRVEFEALGAERKSGMSIWSGINHPEEIA